jgi:hypothetical protein
MCANCEYVTLTFVPTAPRRWTATIMGREREWIASNPPSIRHRGDSRQIFFDRRDVFLLNVHRILKRYTIRKLELYRLER